jgi:hypothetical protein
LSSVTIGGAAFFRPHFFCPAQIGAVRHPKWLPGISPIYALPPENALWPDAILAALWFGGNNAAGIRVGKTSGTFKAADVTRAFKAAKKAGIDVKVAIDLEHKRMMITPVKVRDANGENEWDEVFDNGDDQAPVR